MKILLTQHVETIEPRTLIAIMDLAAYGRKFGHDIDVGYHERMEAIDGYDWVGYSALTFDRQTLDSIRALRRRWTGTILVGGKATEYIVPEN